MDILSIACDKGLVVHPADEKQTIENLRTDSRFPQAHVSESNRYVSPEIYALMRKAHLDCLSTNRAKECELH